MIVLAVELHQLCLEVCAHASKDNAQIIKYLLGKYIVPVLSNKDQM